MGGYKFILKDGNTIELQRLVNSCEQANKKQWQKFGLVGDFGILNLEGFSREVKCEAHSQPG